MSNYCWKWVLLTPKTYYPSFFAELITWNDYSAVKIDLLFLTGNMEEYAKKKGI